jgi:hypothetical protein
VRRPQLRSWLPLIVLVVTTAGAVILGLSTQPTVPLATQLNAALSATYNAPSYVTFVNGDYSNRTIVNTPDDRSETFQHGKIFQIWNGQTIYTAVPKWCSNKQRFVETLPSEESGFASARFVGFPLREVTKVGDRFTVTKSGRHIEEFIVHNGYVVETITEPTTIQGHKTPRFAITFSDFSRAPRIAIPRASDVILSPPSGLQNVLHGCPIESSLTQGING